MIGPEIPDDDGIIGFIGPQEPEEPPEPTKPKKSFEAEAEEVKAVLGEDVNLSAFGGELTLGQYIDLVKTARAVEDYLKQQELLTSAFESEVESLRIQLDLDAATPEELYTALANTTPWIWQTKPKYYAALEVQVYRNVLEYQRMRKEFHSKDQPEQK